MEGSSSQLRMAYSHSGLNWIASKDDDNNKDDAGEERFSCLHCHRMQSLAKTESCINK